MQFEWSFKKLGEGFDNYNAFRGAVKVFLFVGEYMISEVFVGLYTELLFKLKQGPKRNRGLKRGKLQHVIPWNPNVPEE